MLGFGYEFAHSDPASPLLRLAGSARELWPEFAESVNRLGGGIGYDPCGALAMEGPDSSADLVETIARRARELGMPAERLTGAQAKALEPALTTLRSALWLPADGQVDAQLLCAALARAIRRLGGRMNTALPVSDIPPGPPFRIDGELYDGVVLATGAAALPFELPVAPIVPVKGQMVALKPHAGAPRMVLRGAGVYVAPKERWTLVGATSERGVSDETTDPVMIDALRLRAGEMAAGLVDVPEVERWAGIRPGTPDDLPVIGPAGPEGVWCALGHYRNGVCLAPATAEMLVRSMIDGRAADGGFSPQRFDKSATAAHSAMKHAIESETS
jgi:glycine oxidase